MLRRFSKGMSQSERAVQAWNILIGKAENRQTLNYGELSKLMNYGSNHLGGVLYHLKAYCEQNDLPRLSYLVVNKEKGQPGGIEKSSFEEQESIFNIDWYEIITPTAKEFKDATDQDKNNND